MTPPDETLVFSYGSNMPAARIGARSPGARFVTTGYVTHRKLAFHKRSIDGSAKADAQRTNNETDRVWGVVYSVSAHGKGKLDACESLGTGYDEEQVTVHSESGPVRAWIYFARAETIDESLMPYAWYLRFVVVGAEQNGLPDEYIQALREIESTPDPDRQRREHNRRIL